MERSVSPSSGSIFASSYAPKIITAFRSLSIPAGPKSEAHQSVAATLAVVAHAPVVVRPHLQAVAFTAFHSGLEVACIAGAGVAALGALGVLGAFRLLPGRPVVATLEAVEASATGGYGGDLELAPT